MDPRLRIVTGLPLTELWNEEGPVTAVQLEALSADDVRARLRLNAVGVLASIGEPLRWLQGTEFFEWWKVEAKPRLVEPQRPRHYDIPSSARRHGAARRVPSDGYRLEDFPDERCWSACEWQMTDGSTVIVFEEDH